MRQTLGPGAISAIIRQSPLLLFEAVRVFFATRKRTGVRPSSDYLEWRSHTGYGAVIPMPANEFVAFLQWRRGMRQLRRRA